MARGTALNEFDIQGVPVSLYICHDHRYPELQTLPVMFGARLLLHPSNGGVVSGTVSAFEATARAASRQTHAFHMMGECRRRQLPRQSGTGGGAAGCE